MLLKSGYQSWCIFFFVIYLSLLTWKCSSSFRNLICDCRDVPPLLIQNHVQLPIKLFDFKMNSILPLKDLPQFTITYSFKKIIR